MNKQDATEIKEMIRYLRKIRRDRPRGYKINKRFDDAADTLEELLVRNGFSIGDEVTETAPKT